MNCDSIKLVIWDLDETFWQGILSEGPIEFIEENIRLVKDLTDRGIINTICSKNTFEDVDAELVKKGIGDYFVFKSIDWTPKGQRIAALIKEMGLRPVNCLFIDDNEVNLNEAKFYSPDLMIALPDVLSELREFVNATEPSDIAHKRLGQYHVLEEKQKARLSASSNLDFLYSANTQVEIHNDCLAQIDRITELVNRTNQLNFTKVRSSKEELIALLSDDTVSSGYVTAKDNFGDYGIVGFYAVKEGRCLHFLFSCRTIGQGVEQWVYSTIGCPELETIGDVVNDVKKEEAPAWINQNKALCAGQSKKTSYAGKIVMKGPCDMDILASFLSSDKIITEFTYIGERGSSIEHHNHSINYLQFPFLSKEERDELLDDCIFNDPKMFDTSMFDEDVGLVFLSTQIEPNLGIYKNKKSGRKIAFGEYFYPLTDESLWPEMCRQGGEINTYLNIYNKEWLESFKSKYEYIGRLTPEEYLENVKRLLSMLPEKTHLCLVLGSEIPYEANKQPAYADRHLCYKALNGILKDFAKSCSRLHFIEFTKYIRSQSDFLDNINHYQREVYYQASLDANKIIEQVQGYRIKNKGIAALLFDKVAFKIRDSKIYKLKFVKQLKKIYFKLR